MYNHQDINFNFFFFFYKLNFIYFLIKIYHKRKVQLISYKKNFTKYYNYHN